MQSIRSHRTHSMRIKGRLGFTLIAQVCIAAILFATIANVWAQNMKPMGHRDHADQAAPSTQLALRGLSRSSIRTLRRMKPTLEFSSRNC